MNKDKIYTAQVRVLRVRVTDCTTGQQVMDANFFNQFHAEEVIRGMVHAGFNVIVGYTRVAVKGTSPGNIEEICSPMEDGIIMPKEYYQDRESQPIPLENCRAQSPMVQPCVSPAREVPMEPIDIGEIF